MDCSKLNTMYTYHDIRWGKGWNGKKYIVQQKRYKVSEDAIFRVNDSIDYKEALSKNVYNLKYDDLSFSLTKALSELMPREERIIRMRYGIGLDRVYTLDEIGLQFNVTRERIRSLQLKALRELKRILRKGIVS